MSKNEIAEKIQSKQSEWDYETIIHLRLLLLGQLVEITGIIWLINFDINKWNLMFNCHYGFGRHEVLSTDLSLTELQGYFDYKLNRQAWIIAKAYWKRMGKRYVFDE